MHLQSATTLAFLGWRTANAIPTLGTDNNGLVIEKMKTSGHFVEPELQHRSSRFLNEATARESR
jgi:hypothetical protein